MSSARSASIIPGQSLTVIVLAGGTAERMGRLDKTAIVVGGRTLLDHVIAAWPDDVSVIVVGPTRPTQRPVSWCRESPAGGGPVSAVTEALRHVTTDWVAIAAGDSPGIAPGVQGLLDAAGLHAQTGGAGARALGTNGHLQTMPCCVRSRELIRVLPDTVDGAALWRVLDKLDLVPVVFAAEHLQDVDTPADLDRVRQQLASDHGRSDRPDVPPR